MKEKLFSVRKDVVCLKCNCKGAIRYYGTYYPNGIKKDNLPKSLEKYKNTSFMDYAIGFGGTIPYECLNCGNNGLIDIEGLEGYKKAFTTIKNE